MKTTLRDLAVVRSAVAPVTLLPEAPGATVPDAAELDADADMPSPEVNAQPAKDLERASYRADSPASADSPVMTVEFSAFGAWYEIDSYYEGRFLERVAPGAFVKTINERASQVKVLFNHGMEFDVGDKILGPISLLEERADGPYGEVPLLDTSYNRDLIPGLREGVYGSSFMFNVISDSWVDDPGRSDHNPDGIPERTIREVRLLEFGPVTWPANPAATAGLRSNTDHYANRMRSRNPDTFESIAERFSDFRAEHGLGTVPLQRTLPEVEAPAQDAAAASSTSTDEAAPDTTSRDTAPPPEAAASDVRTGDTPTSEAANDPTDAPDSDEYHATGLSPDQRAAQMRELELLEIS